MLMILALQAETSSWVGPTVALSLVVVAAAYVGMAVAVVLAGRAAARQSRAIAAAIDRLQADLTPALHAAKLLAEDGRSAAALVKEEATALVDTSRQLRERFERGADRVQERLEDLEALYEVVAEEVEETALEVAATLRTVRTGAGWLRGLRRLLARGRRR